MEGFCICKTDCDRYPIKGGKYAHGHRPKPELKKCACGQCDEMVKGTWAHGHYARKNNPSTIPEVKAKRSESAKRRIANGERSFAGWNKDLSKETDIRVASYGQKNSESLQLDFRRREKRSQSCKKQWDEGRIHVNKGEDCHQWKGGVSALVPWCRTAVHRNWGRPIMKRDGWSCKKCGATNPLVVHHDDERFASIMQKVLDGRQVPSFTVEEKQSIVDEVVKYHLDNSVSGITLCRPCHDAVHEIDPDVD